MNMHTRNNHEMTGSRAPFAPPAFRVLLGLAGLLAVLVAGGIATPVTWALAVLCGFVGYRFSEALLVLFVVFFPVALFISGVAAYLLS